MIEKIPLDKMLFLDIETAPQVYLFDELDEIPRQLFSQKVQWMVKEDKQLSDLYNERSSIFAEFGKIICISVGFVNETRTGREIRMKTFHHSDEETLLKHFFDLLNNNTSKFSILCGHNAKEFDFPYICRRALINGLRLPEVLNIAGKKPWEIAHIDTMELWKFGDYKAYTSLPLLCHVFGVPTPKDDISGADVARVYHEDNDLNRIARYCEKDVVALIQLFLKMRGAAMVAEGDVYTTEFS